MGSPNVPDVPTPAERPERVVDVEPEDIVLGTEENLTEEKTRGKRSLLRPTGNVPTAATSNAALNV